MTTSTDPHHLPLEGSPYPASRPVEMLPALSSADTPQALALARLAASRIRLRAQLIPPPRAARRPLAPGAPRGWLHDWLARPLAALRRSLGGNSVVETAVQGVGRWWEQHPMHDVAELVGAEVATEWRNTAVPLLRRHPIGSVAVAGLLGAAVVTAAPWRSRALRARLRPLPARVGRWAFAQIPLQTVLTSLVVMMATRHSGAPGDEPSAGGPR